jgi:Spy/CpxP family protein refolding chaperone
MNGESSRRKAALWVIVVFVLGIALGAIVGYGYAYRSYAAMSAPSTDQAKRAHKVEELTRLLDLTNEQQQKLDKALTVFQGQMKEIRKQSEPQMDEVRKKGRAEIRGFLTREQISKFDEFVQKLDTERKKNLQ